MVVAALFILNKAVSGDFARMAANTRVQLFSVLLFAILLEGLAFILIGSLISGAIEVCVPGRILEERVFPKRRLSAALVGALAGVVFPVCSCGTVPVARRLLRKGVPPAGAVAYLLAAPVINPITLAATAFAFPQTREMVWARAIFAYGVAVATALALGQGREEILSPDQSESDALEHHHHTDVAPDARRLRRILLHAEDDFFLTGRFFVLGGTVAALLQTLIPRAVFTAVADLPALSVGMMEALGVAFSLCSFADAFVASSFTGIPSAAKAAFLVAGPMAGGCVIALYLGAFRKRFVVRLVACVVSLVFVGAFAWAVVAAGR